MENNSPTHVVGIGASAGGLKAIDNFFREVPLNSGAAYVLVQHLSPDFKSLMDEILARYTELPIHRVEDEMPVEADAIYLIPPKKNMIISDSRLLLSEQVRTGGVLSLPIDMFLHSLAADFGDKSIAVIMSGTGSDGSRGLQAIHKSGGMVIVQSPESASFDGMPIAAIETDMADEILTPREMPHAIVKRIHGNNADELVFPVVREPLQGVEAVFELLRDEYRIDFGHYRDTTIARRLERRIELTHCGTLEQYLQLVRESPEELNSLYADLLIGTTNFFRDKVVWKDLEEKIIPELFKHAEAGNRELRVWSAACGTGEEAYSIAILLAEHAERLESTISIKVFATDVHQQSLDKAAARWFDHSIEDHISPERLQNFFTRRGAEYQVSQRIRRMVVFAQQNVMTNAPFTNVDLVLCRNLLIYFEPLVQRKVLSLFRKDGVLCLGSSETLGNLADDFDKISSSSKIFRKLGEEKLATVSLAGVRPSFMQNRLPKPLTNRLRIESLVTTAYELALEEFVESGLLIDADQTVIHVFGNAIEFLNVPKGQMSANARDLLLPELVPVVTASLHRAQRERTNIRYPKLRVPLKPVSSEEGASEDKAQAEATSRYVELLVCPLVKKKMSVTHFLLLIQDAEVSRDFSRETVTMGELTRGSQVDDLESELQFTRESLQAANEELETSNEELQATNEELVAANEEMQSTNEELQASNEELQSANEELQSVNEELHTVSTEHQERVRELTEVTADLENLLDNIDVGVLFLDREICIRKYTMSLTRWVPLIPRDIGRSIIRVVTNLDFASSELAAICENVMDSSQASKEQVVSADEYWLSLRILPYLDEDHAVTGCVLTLTDVTESTRMQNERDKRTAELQASHQDLQDFAYIASHDLKSPMINITEISSILREDYGSQFNDDGKRFLDALSDSASRMQSLIDDLLEFSRVHARAREFVLSDCNQALDSALKRLNVLLEEVDAKLIRSLLPSLAVDDRQIAQLFQILISNAIEYRSTRALEITLSARHEGSVWVFSVADNGIGMAPDALEKIFTIFYRLHTQEEYQGTGLGLAICKRIVERHQGEIWAESKPGEGSTFYFTLPSDLGAKLIQPAEAVANENSAQLVDQEA
jgi:two-component system CheB/CheR fusion protein